MGPCEVEGDGPGKVERRSSWSGERLYRVKSPPPGLVSDEQGRASDIKTYSSYTSSYTWKKYFYHWVKYLGGEPEGANIPSVWGNHIKIPGGSCPSVGQRISSWSIRHMKVLEPLVSLFVPSTVLNYDLWKTQYLHLSYLVWGDLAFCPCYELSKAGCVMFTKLF